VNERVSVSIHHALGHHLINVSLLNPLDSYHDNNGDWSIETPDVVPLEPTAVEILHALKHEI
jgi:hypothetical protein